MVGNTLNVAQGSREMQFSRWLDLDHDCICKLVFRLSKKPAFFEVQFPKAEEPGETPRVLPAFEGLSDIVKD